MEILRLGLAAREYIMSMKVLASTNNKTCVCSQSSWKTILWPHDASHDHRCTVKVSVSSLPTKWSSLWGSVRSTHLFVIHYPIFGSAVFISHKGDPHLQLAVCVRLRVCECVIMAWVTFRTNFSLMTISFGAAGAIGGEKQSENNWFFAQWERLGFSLVVLTRLNPNLGDKIPCLPNVPLRGRFVVSPSSYTGDTVRSEQLMKESFPWSEGQIQIWCVLILKVRPL